MLYDEENQTSLTCVCVQFFTGGALETGRTLTFTRGLAHSLHPEALVLAGKGAARYNRKCHNITNNISNLYVSLFNPLSFYAVEIYSYGIMLNPVVIIYMIKYYTIIIFG